MATSNPSPAEAPAAPTPRHEKILTINRQIAAIDELIGLARRTIRVFDADLSAMGWNGPARIEKLGTFLHGSRHARLDIIVHDTRYLESRCPRLRQFQRVHSGAVAIFQSGPTARHALDPMVLIDERHYLHRFHIDHAHAALGIDDPLQTQQLLLRFNDVWASREGELPATSLGL